jgi:type 1 glutamine amidotransferase
MAFFAAVQTRQIVSHFRRAAALGTMNLRTHRSTLFSAPFLVVSLGGCGGKVVTVLETQDGSAPPGVSASGSVATSGAAMSTGVTPSAGSPVATAASTGSGGTSTATGATPRAAGTPIDTIGAAAPSATIRSDPYGGPFKILVLSKTLGFHHDSIPSCQQMLRELGRCVDATSCAATGDAIVQGAKPNSAFTVDVAGAPAGCMELPSATVAANDPTYTTYVKMGCDGSGGGTDDPVAHFTATNLDTNQFTSPAAPKGPYQMIFFCSPTGPVFTSDGATGTAGMAAIQSFIEAGGAYGGVHAAADFEDTEQWQWYYDDLMGAWFTDHNNDGTWGVVNTTTIGLTHPVMRGIPNPWIADDEWWLLNREISSVPAFQILATMAAGMPYDAGVPDDGAVVGVGDGGPEYPQEITVAPLAGEAAGDVRPVVWVKPFPVASDPTNTFEGRMFYTIRGHNIARYGETAFRQLVHQGILWAAHRLE